MKDILKRGENSAKYCRSRGGSLLVCSQVFTNIVDWKIWGWKSRMAVQGIQSSTNSPELSYFWCNTSREDRRKNLLKI